MKLLVIVLIWLEWVTGWACLLGFGPLANPGFSSCTQLGSLFLTSLWLWLHWYLGCNQVGPMQQVPKNIMRKCLPSTKNMQNFLYSIWLPWYLGCNQVGPMQQIPKNIRRKCLPSMKNMQIFLYSIWLLCIQQEYCQTLWTRKWHCNINFGKPYYQSITEYTNPWCFFLMDPWCWKTAH